MPIPPTILLADNDIELSRATSEQILKEFNCRIVEACDEQTLLTSLNSLPVKVVLLDLSIVAQRDRSLLLNTLHNQYSEVIAIVLIPDGDTASLGTVVDLDLFFYIKKPYNPQEVIVALKKAFHQLDNSSSLPDTPKQELSTFYGMIGNTSRMVQLFDLIQRVAADDLATVLIRGESGTGKELVAKAIHMHSSRANNNFVPVNCAAIPDDLLESELFGYTKGAFTGASQSKPGRIQYADGGTLFLDEIGDMKSSLQAKLLRVLQEKEFEPVGAYKATPVDTRIVAATHCDLEQMVNDGTFREDLYYRLSVIPLNIPSLRDRKDDIPLLLEYFTDIYTHQRGKETITFSKEVTAALLSYEWRGNVRELENLIQHMSILYCGKTLTVADLPQKFTEHIGDDAITETVSANTALPQPQENRAEHPLGDINLTAGQVDFKELINDYETQLIVQAMKTAGGNKKEAARLLNLKRTTLLEKIKKKELNNLWHE